MKKKELCFIKLLLIKNKKIIDICLNNDYDQLTDPRLIKIKKGKK